jgi:hypothetical protein
MSEEKQVNYIYFGLLFAFLSFLHIYQIFLIQDGSSLHRTFYIIYAIGQCLLEIGVLTLVGHYMVKKFPKILNPLFIFMTFILFMIHIVDFPLVRLFDWSIWYVLDFVSAESYSNFIEMLYASNVSIQTWLIGGIVALLLPVLGVIFFRLTNMIAKKRPLNVSYASAAFSLLTVVLFLSMFDFKTCKLATPGDDARFLKALPWKSTFFTTPYPTIGLRSPLKQVPDEKDVMKTLATYSCTPLRKPNIFLFVIESLREDYISPEIAPALSRFRDTNISFEQALSSGDTTNYSWFSLFHSRYPLYWGKTEQKTGALPLKILKKAGYKIHVYTSARFAYYEMDELLFGKNRALADSFHEFGHDGITETYESDAQCMERLQEDMELYRNEDGHLFLVFFDSTHFDYSWPRQDALEFGPVDDRIDYLKVVFSNADIAGIKNRYRNAIFYLDSLFGLFYKKLESMTTGEEAIAVVTGDHGEEFFEDGHLFHLSSLNKMQTHVPLYYKFGENNPKDLAVKLTSHVDIFPTILDYLFDGPLFAQFFDGESIFREKKRPFAITARYNASRTPYEFFVHNGQNKCIFRFLNQRNIFHSHALQVLSKKNKTDESVAFELGGIEDEFKPAFEYLFGQK